MAARDAQIYRASRWLNSMLMMKNDICGRPSRGSEFRGCQMRGTELWETFRAALLRSCDGTETAYRSGSVATIAQEKLDVPSRVGLTHEGPDGRAQVSERG